MSILEFAGWAVVILLTIVATTVVGFFIASAINQIKNLNK